MNKLKIVFLATISFFCFSIGAYADTYYTPIPSIILINQTDTAFTQGNFSLHASDYQTTPGATCGAALYTECDISKSGWPHHCVPLTFGAVQPHSSGNTLTLYVPAEGSRFSDACKTIFTGQAPGVSLEVTIGGAPRQIQCLVSSSTKTLTINKDYTCTPA